MGGWVGGERGGLNELLYTQKDRGDKGDSNELLEAMIDWVGGWVGGWKKRDLRKRPASVMEGRMASCASWAEAAA